MERVTVTKKMMLLLGMMNCDRILFDPCVCVCVCVFICVWSCACFFFVCECHSIDFQL